MEALLHSDVPPQYTVYIIAEQFYKRETNCTCAVPCERVVYEPKLSYAQLSHLNILRFVFESNSLDTPDGGSYGQMPATSQDQLEQLRVNMSVNFKYIC